MARQTVEAAVDVQVGTGDVSGFRAGQEAHQGCDVGSVPVATLRGDQLEALGEVASVRIRVGVNRTRLHIVDGKPWVPRSRANPRVNEATARLVMPYTDAPGPGIRSAIDAADVDGARPVAQVLHRRAGRVPVTESNRRTAAADYAILFSMDATSCGWLALHSCECSPRSHGCEIDA